MDASSLRARVAELEEQLAQTKAEITMTKGLLARVEAQDRGLQAGRSPMPVSLPLSPALHNLLLLSDSALPLGSFAYSSGLESFLAHHKPSVPSQASNPLFLFHKFLTLSLHSTASLQVPYVLAASRDPLSLMDLDNDLDASTPCTVARRASVAQGRALLSVWEKAFAAAAPEADESGHEIATTTLRVFSRDLKLAALSGEAVPTVNGHFAPLWGVVSSALGLNLEETAYLFLLNHVKAVVSAAVRASVMGPYMAQTVLGSEALQKSIRRELETTWFVTPEDAAQGVAPTDLWIGRHELLYSRIFNS